MSEKMTIAQALRRIKNLKGQISENQERARLGVSYETTKIPAFLYREAVELMFSIQDEMIGLESRVAIANAKATVQSEGTEVTMAFAIRTLQELKGRIAFLKGLHLRNETVKERSNDWDDVEMKHIARVTETIYVSDLTEQERDQQVKALQKRFEALNNDVENANHQVMV